MIQDDKIIHKTRFGRTDVFEIVDKFPNGYVVWPIGRANFPYEGFIPLARPTDVPYHIDMNSLKALRVDEPIASDILKEVHYREVNSMTFDDVVSSLMSFYDKR